MRIQDSNASAGASRAGNENAVSRVGAGSAPNTASAAAASGNDHVQLSGVTQVIQNGAAQHANHIASLSQLVRSGNYSAPTSAVSGSLVSETLAQARQ